MQASLSQRLCLPNFNDNSLNNFKLRGAQEVPRTSPSPAECRTWKKRLSDGHGRENNSSFVEWRMLGLASAASNCFDETGDSAELREFLTAVDIAQSSELGSSSWPTGARTVWKFYRADNSEDERRIESAEWRRLTTDKTTTYPGMNAIIHNTLSCIRLIEFTQSCPWVTFLGPDPGKR